MRELRHTSGHAGHVERNALNDNPQNASLVITTDGEDNCSERTAWQAKALLDECRARRLMAWARAAAHVLLGVLLGGGHRQPML